jgi:ribosomal protein S18 acetylase RimI-like enzyme
VVVTESRAYADGDLRRLIELEQELWRADPADVECDFGQLAFWSQQLLRSDWEARLWFEGGSLVGWGWLAGGNELEAQVRPTHRALLEEILDWARPATMAVTSGNADAIARLRAHGLAHDPDAPWMRRNQRALDDLPEPELPDGYALRTIADGADIASRAACHRAAFHPSRFTDEVYEVVRSAWPYRADLDCVVEAPDGSVAAYTLAWLDEANRLGELEPVGTHPDHQRRGLGRAVNLFALRRLREAGATEALVACRGDDAYPIPRLLYESVGFRERTRYLTFVRG